MKKIKTYNPKTNKHQDYREDVAKRLAARGIVRILETVEVEVPKEYKEPKGKK